MIKRNTNMSSLIEELLAKADVMDIPIDYNDDDIAFVDNLRLSTEPLQGIMPIPMNTVAFVKSGRVRIDINGTPVELRENDLFVCPPSTVFSDYLFSPDLEVKLLLLSNRIIQSFLRDKVGVWNQALYVHHIRTLTLKPEDADFFSNFYKMVRLFINAEPQQMPYRTDILQAVLCAGLLGLCSALSLRIAEAEAPGLAAHGGTGGGLGLFQRFLDLLSSGEIKRRPIAYYADRLCVTPKYLSAVCRQTSGKTAGEWIKEYTLEDIRHYLRSTDLSLKQVCDRLGFPNPSFFGRYVRQHFGMSPGAFREGERGYRL